MTLKDLTKKFIAEIRAGQVGEALDTASEILKTSAGFYKLLFGGAGSAAVSVTATPEDLADVETELSKVYDEVAGRPAVLAAADGSSGSAVDPTLILLVIDMVLKLIAERRKNK